MTDINARNRQIKRLLEAEFGRGKVRVRNGRGTSWGWTKIDIDLTPLDREEAEQLHRRAAVAIKSVEFDKYYMDDGFNTEALRRTIRFNPSQYRQTIRGNAGTLYALPWDSEQWVSL